MDFDAIYHLVFETYVGIAILVGSGLVLSIIVSAILELRTKRMFEDRKLEPEDEWEIIEDSIVEGEAEELAKEEGSV